MRNLRLVTSLFFDENKYRNYKSIKIIDKCVYVCVHFALLVNFSIVATAFLLVAIFIRNNNRKKVVNRLY